MPKLDEKTLTSHRITTDAFEVLSLIIDAREAQGPDGSWLDLIMPNGKPLRDCTFGEMSELALSEGEEQ